MQRRAVRVRAVMVLLPFAVLSAACDSQELPSPTFVDTARVAEALRRAEPVLAGSCDNGFRGFVEAVGRVIAEVPGSQTIRESIEPCIDGEELDPARIPDPAFLRLLLQRYGTICSAPRNDELLHGLTALVDDGDDVAADEIRDLLQQHLSGLDIELRAIEGSQVIVDLPATGGGQEQAELDATRSDDDASDGSELVTFLACLQCRQDERIDGPTQVAAAIGAIDAIASSGVVLTSPLRLVICLDALRKPTTCAEGFDSSTRRSRAAFAIDGTEPLVVAWSAEVSWHLELAHHRADARWMAIARRQATKIRGDAPFVIDAGAEGTLEELPPEAWMVLYDPRRKGTDLVSRVEAEIAALEPYRQGAEFSVSAVSAAEGDGDDELVRVTARTEARSAWEIGEGRNALWDLAALAGALRVVDPPRGGNAAMLRVVERFDGDSNGRRLGLSYADPVGGPLLVAPCSLSAHDGNIILAIRMYRPPGLERRAFLRRLDDARARLRHAAGRAVGQAERTVGEPSSVNQSSETVRIVQRIMEEVSGAPAPPPSGSTRPGLGTLLPQAISLRPPTQSSRVSAHPEIALIIDLAWFMAIATDPEVRRASQWN